MTRVFRQRLISDDQSNSKLNDLIPEILLQFLPNLKILMLQLRGFHRKIVGRMTPCQTILLKRDAGACRSGEVNDLRAFEAGFAAPSIEVRAGEIKRVPKFDQHIQRHH